MKVRMARPGDTSRAKVSSIQPRFHAALIRRPPTQPKSAPMIAPGRHPFGLRQG